MELSLIRSLMEKQFYEEHRGSRCPMKLFSKDIQKVKRVIDKAMDDYNRSVSPDEVEALFLSDNPSLTTAQKQQYTALFGQIKTQQPMGKDIAQEVLSKLFQQVIGEEVANLGFDFVNGSLKSLQPLRNLLEIHGDDFIPKLQVQWEDMNMDRILEEGDLQSKWTFNIPSLARKVPGVNAGQLIEIGARSNTGKTSFHASSVMGPNGFADQGAKVIVLCNEETPTRVGHRYLTCAVGTDADGIRKDKATHLARYKAKSTHLKFKDSTEKDMSWVESVCKYYKPDIVMLDMGDKFTSTANSASIHEVLKQNVMYARQIAKQQECAVFYMSQLSAEAEGRVVLNQSMMEGSKTGKAAEADLMLLLARNPPTENQTEEDTQRHINIAKNKLTGWHGMVTCEFDYKTALFSA